MKKPKKKSIFDLIVFYDKDEANKSLLKAIQEAKKRDSKKYSKLGEVKLADPRELSF